MSHKKREKKWYKKWWGILIIIISFLILSFIIGSALYVYNRVETIKSGNIQTQRENKEKYFKQRQELAQGLGNYSLGKEDAPIVIVEWSDFACPASKRAFDVNQKIVAAYPEKVKLIHRDYPVISENSKKYAIAAHCAGEQTESKFWRMAELMFENQSELGPEKINSLAKQLNLNTTKFRDCVNNPGYKINKKIEKDIADAGKLQIEATPSYIIEGRKIQGKLPYKAFEELINKLLTQ